jgi:allantoin racemase
VASARAVAAPGTEIVGAEPLWGPDSVEGYYDSFLSAAGILDRLHQLMASPDADGSVPFDALVWSGFGEHGKEAAMELLSVPVITITDAAAAVAMLIGHKFGVVTSLARAIPQIEDQYRLSGALERCAAIRATNLGVLELEGDHELTVRRFVEEGRACIEAGADVLILGCGGMAGMDERLTAELGTPVVDGVAAAVKLCEAVVGLGLSTSKINAFAAPLPKSRPGWPRNFGA